MSNIRKIIEITSRIQPKPKASCSWYVAFLRNYLSEEKHEAFEDHLSECMVCQANVNNERLMAHLIMPINLRLLSKREA